MRKIVLVVLALALLVIAFASIASAQAPTYTATFTASPDHNVVSQTVPLVTNYELVVFAPGSTTALPAINLQKPTPDATNTIRVNVTSQLNALPASPNCSATTPTAAQCYTALVRAVGPGGSNASPISDPFSLTVSAPGAAGKPAISKQ